MVLITVVWTALLSLKMDVPRVLAFLTFVLGILLGTITLVFIAQVVLRVSRASSSTEGIAVLRLGLNFKTWFALTCLTLLYIPICRRLVHAWRHVYNDPAYPFLPPRPELGGRTCCELESIRTARRCTSSS
jgi:hypothetical protein